MAAGATEAPGEAPSRPAMEPSMLLIRVVPNSREPKRGAAVGLITWTRWPATTVSQSSALADGT